MPETTLTLDGLVNFRDLGGIPVAGGTTRHGVLYRAESLSDLSEDGRRALTASDIGTVIDLRGAAESTRAPGVDPSSTTPRLVAVPMLDGASPTSLKSIPTLHEIYASLINDHGTEFAVIARTIAQKQSGVLIHCTAGKDRTGLAIALTLLAVGAELADVRADYLSSADRLAGPWADRMRQRVRAAGFDIPDTPEISELLHGTSEPAFDETVRTIETEYGGAAEYLLRHGLGADELELLRSRLVEASA